MNGSLRERLVHSSLTSSDYYWNSYAHFGIHEEMLKDSVRTNSYKNSILKNPDLFEGKVVLDVGCGTGILSLFCADAGASKVYAIECSDIILQARQIGIDNNKGNVIEYIQGKLEEIELPEKVDIIVSEWMGYCLFYESMLSTVILAREKFLKPGGLIFPDKANLYLALIEDGDYKREKIEFWNNVYGFNFSCIRPIAFCEPLVDTVKPEVVVSEHTCIYSVDLYTVEIDQLEFTVPYEIRVNRNDFAHAFIAWFDIEFSACKNYPVYFSTSPYDRNTHWKQTVFYLEEDLTVNTGNLVRGVFECKLNKKNPRELDFKVQIDFEGPFNQSVHNIQYFRLQ